MFTGTRYVGSPKMAQSITSNVAVALQRKD